MRRALSARPATDLRPRLEMDFEDAAPPLHAEHAVRIVVRVSGADDAALAIERFDALDEDAVAFVNRDARRGRDDHAVAVRDVLELAERIDDAHEVGGHANGRQYDEETDDDHPNPLGASQVHLR